MSLQDYVAAWHEATLAIGELELDDQSGALDTSLPGWKARDVLAHLVHLEEVLAYGETASHEAGAGMVTSDYTQAGVEALAEVPVAELLTRLDRAVAERSSQLTSLPEDAAAPADRTPGGVAWDWETLLRNRAIDAWMHEQDIRRAIGKPGGYAGAGAQVTVRSFSTALPFIIGRRARVEPGHPVRIEIDGPVSAARTIVVGEDGRAADTEAEPRTTISMSTETFTRLAGGREPRESFEIRIEGDSMIADRVLANFAITP